MKARAHLSMTSPHVWPAAHDLITLLDALVNVVQLHTLPCRCIASVDICMSPPYLEANGSQDPSILLTAGT